MKDPLDMNSDEMYDYITSQMTPEEALRKLLQAQSVDIGSILYQAKKIEIPSGFKPYFLIALGAQILKWGMAFESSRGSGEMRGMAVGTKEYLNECIK